MKAFLDTSVQVATFFGEHEHHESSFALFLNQKRHSGCTAAHCRAEVYSVLTGMPGKDRVNPDQAMLFLDDVRERLMLVTLSEQEYIAVLEAAVAGGVSGGGIYDALIGQRAINAKAETIYTWNTKHFTRLGKAVAARVKTPGQTYKA